MTGRYVAALVVLALTIPVTTSAHSYRFTYSNPSLGRADAPLILEYFGAVDCGPCLRFERSELAELRSEIESGRLRVIFRDLPATDAKMPLARQVFCLQELDEVLDARLRLKQSGAASSALAGPVAGRPRARFEACLDDPAAETVARHNFEAFSQRGFVATPSFVLTHRSASGRSEETWSGPHAAGVVAAALRRITHPHSLHAGD